MELWSRSYSDLSGTVSSPEVVDHNRNSTATASQVIAASGTGLFCIAIFTLSILGVCFRPCVRLSASRGAFFVFLIGALIAFVNVFINADNLRVKLYFRPAAVSLIGIVFTFIGAVLFFLQPGEERNEPTLGRQQPSMGLVIGIITFPLIVIEIVLIISAQASKNANKSSGEAYKLWTFVMVDKAMFLIQKIFQAVIYLYLRNTITRMAYRANAQFYFRVLSFFNLIEWVDSQVNVDSDIRLSGVLQKLDGWFDVFADLYKALIIDYRLLCCLLFLEHSLEIQTEATANHDIPEGPEVERDDAAVNELEGLTISYMVLNDRQDSRYIGYIGGCVCLIAPVVCGLFYVESLHIVHIGAWVNVFAIVVNLAIIGCGSRLLCANNLDDGENRESIGVKVMVCCLGAVGFTCLMVKASIVGYWAAVDVTNDINDQAYMIWYTTKVTVRGLTTAFLMYLFMKVNARAFSLQNPNRSINYFVVPVIMLGILSVFLESLIDQYFGDLNKKIRDEVKEQSLNILLDVGRPMYLGFLIHVCLHFVIIETKIGMRALSQTDLESSTNSSYSSARSSTISEYFQAEVDIA